MVPPMEAGRIKGASGKKSFVICSRSILKGRSLREEDKAKVNRVLRLSLNQLYHHLACNLQSSASTPMFQ